ncbi:MAG: CatB-related O-acetyltransferase [Methylocystis sp.]|nr:CatB-related O-acetyltransferase [Methylocystis sp.]MCA3589444.1 CatB-related O-acetyltransferase [Methylocystis sp.]MCA3590873.1 CatB-related O-acetyltransferase [Methylocystis sp.]
MNLRHRLKNWSNPHNLTRLHLKAMAERYGYTIGDYTYGSPRVRFPEAGAKLTIGRYCSISDDVTIMVGGNHRHDFITTYPFGAMPELWPEAKGITGHHVSRGDVSIGHDVWLGTGCLVMSGVTIGAGAVIGARAVVTRDVPPYGIVAGNPAALKGHRFPPVIVDRLLATRWWDLPRERIAPLIPLLQGADIEAFLAALEAMA